MQSDNAILLAEWLYANKNYLFDIGWADPKAKELKELILRMKDNVKKQRAQEDDIRG